MCDTTSNKLFLIKLYAEIYATFEFEHSQTHDDKIYKIHNYKVHFC